MVTTLMRQLMPNKIITKALFEDKTYFRATWRGHKLADNLDYGWEMSYGGPPRPRVAPYTRWLTKKQLSLGFWSGDPSRTPIEDAQWLRGQGYAGVMVYGFEDRSGVKLMGNLVDAWYGPRNWERVGKLRRRQCAPVSALLTVLPMAFVMIAGPQIISAVFLAPSRDSAHNSLA